LPAFSVRPKSFWDRIGHWFGTKDVEFESHAAFNGACLVKGSDDVAIRAAFTEPLLDYLVAHPNVQLEGKGERLMYYRGERVKPGPADEARRVRRESQVPVGGPSARGRRARHRQRQAARPWRQELRERRTPEKVPLFPGSAAVPRRRLVVGFGAKPEGPNAP